MSEPLAYLLTWTCYGTWLHGDPRSSVDEDNNTPNTPYLELNIRRATRELASLLHPLMKLHEAARKTTAQVIEAHCDVRQWELLAVNARTNHVHVVVTCPGVTPEHAMTQLKAWTTRRLREGGCVPGDSRVRLAMAARAIFGTNAV